MPSLKMLRGPEPGREITLEGDTLTIGRGRKNDIIIQDNEVSRVHCRLIQVLDDYEIHDLGSTNGTFVNGKPLTQGGWLLHPHSIVELGDSITLEYLPTDVVTVTDHLRQPEKFAEDTLYYLVVKQMSLPQPEIYLLDRARLSLGRDVDNEIILQEPEVSRHHMRLLYTDDGYAVEDLNTVNGTWVNGNRLEQQHMLKRNDMVRVGTRVQIWYTDDPDTLIKRMRDGTLQQKDEDDSFSATESTSEEKRDADDVTLAPTDSGNMLAPSALSESIFLVYSPAEWRLIVGKLNTYLEANGIKTWVPQHLQPNTQDWDDAIDQAQQESPLLLAILSKRSIDEPFVQRSIRHFITRDKPILLVQLGTLKSESMLTENLPKIRFDTKDPMRSFRIILAELRKAHLD